MQTLKIKNFGPIEDVNIEIYDIMIFIGPQASGKSTIAKNIFYFNSVKDFLFETVEEAVELGYQYSNVAAGGIWKNFHRNLRMKFVGFWGTTKHLNDFKLEFSFTEALSISVTLQEGKVSHIFSPALNSGITKIFNKTAKFISNNKSPNAIKGSQFGTFSGKNVSAVFLDDIQIEIKKSFVTKQSSFFVPANRSLITTLPEYLINLMLRSAHDKQNGGVALFDPYLIDLPTKQFINLISFIKSQFSKGLEDMINERSNFSDEIIDHDALQPFLELVPKILKGKYLYESGSEKLFLPESDEFVKINLASSGQQESIWILLHLFRLALNKVSSLMVIEEPETHLYTDTQVELVHLLSHFCNINNNQLIVTTHSPYVLSAFNNLMFAHEVGRKKADKIMEIIPKRYWLDPNRVRALFVENGRVENILEQDLNQIAVERIDNASRIINQQYDQILELLNG